MEEPGGGGSDPLMEPGAGGEGGFEF